MSRVILFILFKQWFQYHKTTSFLAHGFIIFEPLFKKKILFKGPVNSWSQHLAHDPEFAEGERVRLVESLGAWATATDSSDSSDSSGVILKMSNVQKR